MSKMNNEYLMEIAIEEAKLGTKLKDGTPFGALICKKNGQIVATAHNETLKQNDPTAHAEIIAIRKACNVLKCTTLENCILYASAEPCPMCLAACVWSGIKMVYYGAKLDDYPAVNEIENRVAALEKIRDPEFRKSYMVQLMRNEACEVFNM